MKQTILALFFIVGLIFLYSPQLSAQADDPSFWKNFFSLTPAEDPTDNNLPIDFDRNSITEKPVVQKDSLIKPEPSDLGVLHKNTVEAPSSNAIVQGERLIEPLLKAPVTSKKNMVDIPPRKTKQFIDAGDFRDPFLLLRGGREGAEKVLKPGVTVDGVQFNSYNDSDLFVEKVYRDSRFRINDVFGKVDNLEGGGCLYCHRGIERISKNHKFRCTKCHEGNRRKRTLAAAHKNLVANPSDLDHAPKYCGKCHEDQIEQVEQSSMATGKSVINITRYAWGAQEEEDNLYSLRPKEENGELFLPNASEGKPVDLFLRTKCMRCHLQSEAPHRPGDYRAGGCAACHMIYSNDGYTLTQDRAIQSKVRKNQAEREDRFKRKFASKSLENPRAYPVMHKFTTAVPSVQCEHCHNTNGIGNEFEGLFSPAARPNSAFQKIGLEKPVLYGTEHEFLLPDIHRERGMHCIDCHVATDFKGAPASSELHSGVEIRCENCHGTPSTRPKGTLLVESEPRTKRLLASNALNPNLKKKVNAGDEVLVNSGGAPLTHVKKEKDKWVLFSRVTGKKHVIPLLVERKPAAAHKIGRHIESMECHTCHARWSAGEWGMNVIQEDNLDLSRWEEWSFADPTLQNMLWDRDNQNTGMIDWLSAKWVGDKISGNRVPSIILDLFAEKDWNTMILGKNQRGKYSIMKPRYQYFLTDQNKVNRNPAKRTLIPITKDGGPGLILLPHTPHTIRTTGRSCESCHDSQTALGLGDPTRNTIVDSESFLSALEDGSVTSDFQAKQVITEAGDPIQRTYPSNQTRFLNAEEITAIKNKSDSYKAFRYMDLKDRRFPRLLAREEFPYDQLHKNNEKLAGEPKQENNILFNINENNFVVPKHEKPQPLIKKFTNPDLFPRIGQEDVTKPYTPLNKDQVENETIMEFSTDFFGSPTSDKKINSDKDIPIDESKLNGAGF